MKNNNAFAQMQKSVKDFAAARDWERLQTPKNTAMSLAHEASEVMEHFIWATNEEIMSDPARKGRVKKELADVLQNLLILCNLMEIDLEEAFYNKLKELEERYPAEKMRGKSGYDIKNTKNST